MAKEKILETKFVRIEVLVEKLGKPKRTIQYHLRKIKKRLGEKEWHNVCQKLPKTDKGPGVAPWGYDLEWFVKNIDHPHPKKNPKKKRKQDYRYENDVLVIEVKEDKEPIRKQLHKMRAGEKLLLITAICETFEAGHVNLDEACRQHGIQLRDFMHLINTDENIFQKWEETRNVWLRKHLVAFESMWYEKLLATLNTKTLKQVKRKYEYKPDAKGDITKKLVEEQETEQEYIPDTARFMLVKKSMEDLALMLPKHISAGFDVEGASYDELQVELEELAKKEAELLAANENE